MIESEREKLFNRDSEYLSIGITKDGKPRGSYEIPWEKTAHAYNMKLPDVFITPDDVKDEELLKTLHGYRVIGCYIYAPLESYDFLASFTELGDINIFHAEKMRDVSFLGELCECSMLFIEGARLDEIDVIRDVKKKSRGIFGGFRCLALFNCEIKDISSLGEVSFSELIIGCKKDKNEKERWRKIPADTFRYYEL